MEVWREVDLLNHSSQLHLYKYSLNVSLVFSDSPETMIPSVCVCLCDTEEQVTLTGVGMTMEC